MGVNRAERDANVAKMKGGVRERQPGLRTLTHYYYLYLSFYTPPHYGFFKKH